MFGSLTAVALAVLVVVLWTLGLLYDVGSEQLITAMTTVITFVMVFIIQSTQNREGRAMQTKLDALLIANERLDEQRLLGLEQQPDARIEDVQTEVHGAGAFPPEQGPSVDATASPSPPTETLSEQLPRGRVAQRVS